VKATYVYMEVKGRDYGNMAGIAGRATPNKFIWKRLKVIERKTAGIRSRLF